MLTNRRVPFSRNRMLHILIVVFSIYWGISAFSPADPTLWWIENSLLFGCILTLTFTYKKLPLSNLSYLLIFIFLCLHTFAAHYTYQNTPVDSWLKATLHTKRSYFDRVMHFLFGTVWIVPIRENMPEELRRHRVWVSIIPLSIVLSFSAFYEIIEMIVAAFASQVGQQYIGLQGDEFDSQKDMALGFLGGLLSTFVTTIAYRNKGVQKP